MSGAPGGHCPAGRGHRAARSSRPEPGDAQGRVSAPWSRLTAHARRGPSPAGPAQVRPQRPAERGCPAGRSRRPGSAPGPARPRGCEGSGGERLPLSCSPGSPGPRRRRQGPGRRGGRGGGSPGRGPGARRGAESRRAAPAAGRGRCPGARPAAPGSCPLAFPPAGLDPPSGKRGSIRGKRSCRRCRVSPGCRGLGSLHGRPVGSGAPAVRGSGASWSSRRESTLAWRCGGSEGVVMSEGIGAQSPSENQTYGAAALLNFRCLLVKQVQEIK